MSRANGSRHGTGSRPPAAGATCGMRRAIGSQSATASTAGTASTASAGDQPPSSTASGTASALAAVAPTIMATV